MTGEAKRVHMAHPPSRDLRFRRLFEEHRRTLFAYCLRRTSRADAMDAVAETFVVAWRRLDDMPRGEAELSWLYAVAYRVIANQRRGRTRRGNLLMKLGGTADVPAPDPEEQVVRSMEARRIIAALTTLKPADQELIRLITWEEHPRDQVARLMKISRSALDQRIHRAITRLRKAITEPLEDTEFTPEAANGGA